MAKELLVPDIGSDGKVDVIEILVAPGDSIKEDDSVVTLESDKATMEVPSPQNGVVEKIVVKVGDKVAAGSVLLYFKDDATEPALVAPAAAPIVPPPVVAAPRATLVALAAEQDDEIDDERLATHDNDVHATPAVRRVAREFGVDLRQVIATGPKQRILKEDVQQYVKSRLSSGGAGGIAVAAAPSIDFSKFGEITTQPLHKIKRLTGANVHRSWVTVPHVTQFDEADITEMEAFRIANKAQAEAVGVKLTPLVFIMKAVVAALKQFPNFNASLDAKGENLILKKYFHLGIAVDTPNGLVVPVVRNVDQKGFLELAQELAEISQKARKKGLLPRDMEGSCFTISSLGGIGGTAFTPIINTPDVAILGVSRSKMQPVYIAGVFEPRLILPLSLSYDHRVIDGAEAARFSHFLTQNLEDIRQLLL